MENKMPFKKKGLVHVKMPNNAKVLYGPCFKNVPSQCTLKHSILSILAFKVQYGNLSLDIHTCGQHRTAVLLISLAF